jgi:tetratricopeptide (TPR) repeat protein
MKSNRTIAHGLLFFIVLGCVPFVRAQKPEQPASLSQLEASLKRDPNNPKLLVALGLAYWDRNDYPHALEAFQRAVKIGPNSAEAHNWLGVAIMEKADLPGAIAEFKKAVALDPELVGTNEPRLRSAKSGEIGKRSRRSKALALNPPTQWSDEPGRRPARRAMRRPRSSTCGRSPNTGPSMPACNTNSVRPSARVAACAAR